MSMNIDMNYVLSDIHRLVFMTEREADRLRDEIVQIPLISSLTEEGFQILKELGNYPEEWSRIRMSQTLGFRDRLCFRIRPVLHDENDETNQPSYYFNISSRILIRDREHNMFYMDTTRNEVINIETDNLMRSFQLPLMCLKTHILCWLFRDVFDYPLITPHEFEFGSSRLTEYFSDGLILQGIRRDVFFGMIPLYTQ
jgi:hypothetical protein